MGDLQILNLLILLVVASTNQRCYQLKFYLKKYNDLPLVFSNKDSFNLFYQNLKKINFPIYKVKSFYLFESNRWDLITKKNQTVKLPNNNYLESLNTFE